MNKNYKKWLLLMLFMFTSYFGQGVSEELSIERRYDNYFNWKMKELKIILDSNDESEYMTEIHYELSNEFMKYIFKGEIYLWQKQLTKITLQVLNDKRRSR